MNTPLLHLDQIRPRILTDVTQATIAELTSKKSFQPDLLLGEALYQERVRLKREKFNIFTKARAKRDRALWGQVQSGLMSSTIDSDRGQMLEKVMSHYANEIGGHFDEGVYKTATITLPLVFDWLLNAASVKKFSPWKMQERVAKRIHIFGHVEQLKTLSEKGTILLVPTHQSNLDSVLIGFIIYLMGLPPFCYGAGLNLFSNPILSYFMSNLGAYTVDRQKRNEIYKHVLKNYSTRILREGIHSIFFPGGGRSRSGAIESHLKLGLLGTGLEAQLLNLKTGAPKPNVYVVPLVMSYHYVLEASSLIEDFLAESGKHRFLMSNDESWQIAKVANFFYQLFSARGDITVRVGKPLDVFGNEVDETGRSIGPNGTTIDPVKWLSTCGELKSNPARDHEYTRLLGFRVSERFHKDNTVLTSHAVAFTFFEYLRKQYPDLDLYRFLRISRSQRSVDYKKFLEEAERVHTRLLEWEGRGEFFLEPNLHTRDTETWVKIGMTCLGQYHGSATLKRDEDVILSEDMNLLYYYRNRLSGYGLSQLANEIDISKDGYDRKGFLV